VLAFFAPFAGPAASLHPDETETFVEAEVPFPPVPARGSDGRTYLLYELHMTYLPVFPTTEPIAIRRIEVLEGSDGSKVLATFEGKELEKLVHRLGETPAGADGAQIVSGMRTMFFAYLPVEKIPPSLRHRITFETPAGSKKEKTLECAQFKLRQYYPLVIGPPMRGDGWYAVNGPGPSSPHRNAAIPYRGEVHVAQRFAIDWVQIDERGSTRRPDSDPLKNESYYCFGKEAIAVADAVISDLRDGRPDNTPVGQIADEANRIDGLAGNYAVLDIGGGRSAYYCHLQPGSFRVKKGDRVKRGQPIALVGNSGNSTEPHLHFHVANGDVLFESEGLPYAIDSFEIQVTPEEMAPIEQAQKEGKPISLKVNAPGKKVEKVIPMEDTVARFPEK